MHCVTWPCVLQVDLPAVPWSVVKSNVRQAYSRRGLQFSDNFDLYACLQADCHFVADLTNGDADPLVRLIRMLPMHTKCVRRSCRSHAWHRTA
jgi:hypothetical protein